MGDSRSACADMEREEAYNSYKKTAEKIQARLSKKDPVDLADMLDKQYAALTDLEEELPLTKSQRRLLKEAIDISYELGKSK